MFHEKQIATYSTPFSISEEQEQKNMWSDSLFPNHLNFNVECVTEGGSERANVKFQTIRLLVEFAEN